MWAYIVRRILSTIPVMLIVAIVTFLILHLAPGDPAAVMAGDRADPETVALIRQNLGLDEPLVTQLVHWLGNLLRGDLGQSIYYREPVTSLILARAEPTIWLTLATMIVAVVVAIPVGVIAAWQVGTWIDRTIMAISVLGFSLPVFLIGYALVINFSLRWHLLPVQGFVSPTESLAGFFSHLVLPVLSLGLVYTTLLARITRATMLDVLGEDFIRTARAKGASEWRMLRAHALKASAVPIVTTIGSGVALLIGGVVVTESVFAIAGIGRLTVDAVVHRDYPVIQGVILVVAGVYVLINLLIDLSYALFDPRIRY